MNPLQRQMIETGLATPAEIAWAQVQSNHEARTEAALQAWADERRQADAEHWMPILEKILGDHGIGHAIRFASKLEALSDRWMQ